MSNIKINDVFQRIQYAATNGQTQFSIPFPFFSNAYVVVWQDGVVINQGAGAGEYGITGAGSPSGGTITLVTPATLDSIITIEGVMPIDRTSIYSATISNLTGSDLNGDFNREVVMMKQIQTTQALLQLQYAPWAEVSQDETVTTDRYIPLLPPLGAWRMNAGGTAIETFLTPSSGGIAPDDATYIIQVADSELPNAQAMASLASGIVVNTITTGVQLTRLMAGTANQLGVTNPSGIGGNPTYYIVDNPTIPGTAGMGIPIGTTAERVIPTPPSIGLRYNTDLDLLEYYDASLAIWQQLEESNDVAQLIADLASHTAGLGASMIGLENQGSVTNKFVQDLAEATFIAQTDNGTLVNAQFLSALSTGFVGVTTTTGVLNSRVMTGTANQIDVANGDGSGTPTWSISATLNLPGSFNIQGTNAVTAIINDSSMNTATTSNISTSLAIKQYVDSLVTGLNIQGSCVCASTTALTATYTNGASGVGATLTNAGAFAAIQLDGVSPTVGQRVLIKNQASSLQNGIYTVTTVGDGVSVNWVLTRATDYDAPSEIQPGDLVVLTGGTTQNQSSWLQTATVATVGTDSITFVQFTASLPVNVPSGGTGATSFTAYAPIVGGTTTTGSLQSVGLGAAGTLFQSAGVGALPGFTTTTYPSTNAINTIMYASSANVLGVVTPTNNGVLVYSAGGVPSSSTTLPSGLAATSMNLTTPSLGVATATSINKVAITAPATSATLTIADGKTLTQSNTLTYQGTDGSTVDFGAGGTVQYAAGAGGLKSFQIFTSGTAQTYTRPAGITSILVEVIGGGGGGGGVAATGSGTAFAGGGGAGGYARLWVSSASASYTYTVGSGGAGGTAGANNGSTGGTTTFSASSLQATGGTGGQGVSASTGAQITNGGTGGVGSNGNINSSGGCGIFGVGFAASAAGYSGSGGDATFGGGAQGTQAAATGANAGNYGSGGAGAATGTVTNRAGGNGSAGLIIVWEFS